MSSISFISAFDTEKNIGKEYNRLIENINMEVVECYEYEFEDIISKI